MIDVHQLEKSYGEVRAIGGLNFRVEPGEVVGFLGPNGAGKTTTMRILCGCIGASSGTATIGGHDVTDEPEKVKAMVGYLPESPPLYEHMVVRDYIVFAATIKGVANPEAAADKSIQAVGLDREVGGLPASQRIIAHLSKGYKQRVGLAQALVHEPTVLVLDEPTSGLDPAQRREIRDLLLDLARSEKRTVILSTHVLAEVEAICDAVVVINQGAVVAQGSIEELRSASSSLHVQVDKPDAELLTALRAIEGVTDVHDAGGGHYTLSTEAEVRALVAKAAAPSGLLLLQQSEGLEEIYLRLTRGGS